jgi:hypothetical protein
MSLSGLQHFQGMCDPTTRQGVIHPPRGPPRDAMRSADTDTRYGVTFSSMEIRAASRTRLQRRMLPIRSNCTDLCHAIITKTGYRSPLRLWEFKMLWTFTLGGWCNTLAVFAIALTPALALA